MRISLSALTFSVAVLLTGSAQAQSWVQWSTANGGNGHWYKAVVNTNGMTWAQADLAARAEGGHLATITSDAENQFVFSLINSPEFFSGNGGNGSGPALGGYLPDGASNPSVGWLWETGEPWGYTAWAPGQPDFTFETRLEYWSGTQGVPAPTWNNLVPNDSNLGGYVIERDNKPGPAPTGFYGQAFIGTPAPPLLGIPTRAFVTVFDANGKMVGRIPSNPVGQFYSYQKPGNYTLVTTQDSPKGSNSVTNQVTVYANTLTSVQVNFTP